ncbi:MAG: hypothetical protein ACXAD7_14570 [Candidatus Kariarchaeaceae archaeon]|jgi:hypothetical protein
MWKEPKIHSLEAPTDIREKLRKSIYWNSEGMLSGSPMAMIIWYSTILIMIWLFFSLFIFYLAEQLGVKSWMILFIQVSFAIISLLVLTLQFYKWGWKSFQEAWYHFDKDNQIFSVIRKSRNSWEEIEVPYEDIDSIEYVDGDNGKAQINSMSFEFETNRAKDKRRSSKMVNWPISLVCQKCKRKFGHHIGTALCPFCKIILVDPQVKGRIDPLEQHPDDLDRM